MPFGQLLAHDGGADQRWALDRSRNVAQRIELLVRRSKFFGLSDHRATNFAEDAAEIVQFEVDVEAGNGLQFIQRTAGVPQSAPADHRHFDPARGHNRRDDQRSLVSHAAGGVLVHLAPRDLRKVQHLARVEHRVGERGGLRTTQPAKHCGHQKRRHLIIGNFAAGITCDDEFNFIARQFSAIALFADEFNKKHLRPFLGTGSGSRPDD